MFIFDLGGSLRKRLSSQGPTYLPLPQAFGFMVKLVLSMGEIITLVPVQEHSELHSGSTGTKSGR